VITKGSPHERRVTHLDNSMRNGATLLNSDNAVLYRPTRPQQCSIASCYAKSRNTPTTHLLLQVEVCPRPNQRLCGRRVAQLRSYDQGRVAALWGTTPCVQQQRACYYMLVKLVAYWQHT
jgi:hypothetical protein